MGHQQHGIGAALRFFQNRAIQLIGTWLTTLAQKANLVSLPGNSALL
jgi:hypothetical protein